MKRKSPLVVYCPRCRPAGQSKKPWIAVDNDTAWFMGGAMATLLLLVVWLPTTLWWFLSSRRRTERCCKCGVEVRGRFPKPTDR